MVNHFIELEADAIREQLREESEKPDYFPKQEPPKQIIPPQREVPRRPRGVVNT